jgi:phosphoribosylaminoimidazole-succinocarboxamide synthase
MPYADVERELGADLAAQAKDLTVAILKRGNEIAAERGILIADTKVEFGLEGDTLVLADEVLTPDSSRFWDAATWAPGRRLDSYDKQYLRDWLLHDSGWDRHSGEAPPPLPEAVVTATRERYLQAYERLTGGPFAA